LFRKVFRLNKAGKMFIKVVAIYVMFIYLLVPGKNLSIEFGNIRVTASGEVYLLAIGGTKQIYAEANQEGRLNVIELKFGVAFGVGTTNRVRIERI
jgi:hypothetical protein